MNENFLTKKDNDKVSYPDYIFTAVGLELPVLLQFLILASECQMKGDVACIQRTNPTSRRKTCEFA